jgi:hypothetical protein
MEYDGTIKDGVVVFSGNVPLPDGTRVRVAPVAEPAVADETSPPTTGPEPSTLGQRLMKFAGRARGLPGDAARNHDHYLNGTPGWSPK